MSDEKSEHTTELLLLATERQVYAFNLSHRSRVTIGRHESNDLQLASRTVSNFHAEIVSENGRLLARDLGSTNGTHVNEHPIDSERVNTGDQIRVGNHVMTLQLKAVDGPEDAFLRYQKSPQVLGPGTRGRIISMSGRSADALKTIRGVDPNDFTFERSSDEATRLPGSSSRNKTSCTLTTAMPLARKHSTACLDGGTPATKSKRCNRAT